MPLLCRGYPHAAPQIAVPNGRPEGCRKALGEGQVVALSRAIGPGDALPALPLGRADPWTSVTSVTDLWPDVVLSGSLWHVKLSHVTF